MYQVMQKAPIRLTLIVLRSGIALIALPYIAIQVFLTSPPDIVQINASVSQDAPIRAQDVAMHAYMIEHHMNPSLDRTYDPELAADYRAATTLQAYLIEHHMNPNFDR